MLAESPQFDDRESLFAVGRCRGPEWTLIRGNTTLCRLLGGTWEELEGRPLMDLLSESLPEQFGLAVRAAEEGRPVLFHDLDWLCVFQWSYAACGTKAGERKNAYEREAQLQTAPKDAGKNPERVFALHRICLLSATGEHPLSFREGKALLDALHDGIWVIDHRGVTLRVNKAVENMTGIPAEELEGRHAGAPVAQGRYKAAMTLRALQEGRTVTMLDYYENGKRLLNTSTPVFDDAGNIWRVIACIRDMSLLEDMQNRLMEQEINNERRRGPGRAAKTDSLFFVGGSDSMRRTAKDIAKAARSDAVTLILGETGTGKNLAALAVHASGIRRKQPFVTVNCNSIPPTLIESELFGYEKGAFTGARATGKIGLFESAGEGSIFLDEIGELTPQMQAKLLHVLDGHTFTRVGGIKPLRLKARIIAATNRSLERMVAEGMFREDLYYRLNVLIVRMPPLRERAADIPALSRHFLSLANEKNGMVKLLRPEVTQFFSRYAWPGNVRELRAIIEYLVAMTEGKHIGLRDLPEHMNEESIAARSGDLDLKSALARVEREYIAKALAETGSTWRAAKRLNISQASVVRKAKRYSVAVNAIVHE